MGFYESFKEISSFIDHLRENYSWKLQGISKTPSELESCIEELAKAFKLDVELYNDSEIQDSHELTTQEHLLLQEDVEKIEEEIAKLENELKHEQMLAETSILTGHVSEGEGEQEEANEVKDEGENLSGISDCEDDDKLIIRDTSHLLNDALDLNSKSSTSLQDQNNIACSLMNSSDCDMFSTTKVESYDGVESIAEESIVAEQFDASEFDTPQNHDSVGPIEANSVSNSSNNFNLSNYQFSSNKESLRAENSKIFQEKLASHKQDATIDVNEHGSANLKDGNIMNEDKDDGDDVIPSSIPFDIDLTETHRSRNTNGGHNGNNNNISDNNVHDNNNNCDNNDKLVKICSENDHVDTGRNANINKITELTKQNEAAKLDYSDKITSGYTNSRSGFNFDSYAANTCLLTQDEDLFISCAAALKSMIPSNDQHSIIQSNDQQSIIPSNDQQSFLRHHHHPAIGSDSTHSTIHVPKNSHAATEENDCKITNNENNLEGNANVVTESTIDAYIFSQEKLNVSLKDGIEIAGDGVEYLGENNAMTNDRMEVVESAGSECIDADTMDVEDNERNCDSLFPSRSTWHICLGNIRKTAKNMKLVKKFCNSLRCSLDGSFNWLTSHFIIDASTSYRCTDFYEALCSKRPIISFEWVVQSIEEGTLLDSKKYLVYHHRDDSIETLFSKYLFCCYGEFESISKDGLMRCILKCGGQVVADPSLCSFTTDRSFVIVLDESGSTDTLNCRPLVKKYSSRSRIVDKLWVLDSIENQQILIP